MMINGFECLAAFSFLVSYVACQNPTLPNFNLFSVGPVCHNDHLEIKCPENTAIFPQTSFYGRHSPSGDACPMNRPQNADDFACEIHGETKEEYIRKRCDSRQKCRILVTPIKFGSDSCPEYEKYLKIDYFCEPANFKEMVVCSGQPMSIMCPKNQLVHIENARWGVQRNKDSVTPGGCVGSPNMTHRAPCWSTVTDKIVKHCIGLASCNVSTRRFVNPCGEGSHSHLYVTYNCVDKSIFHQKIRNFYNQASDSNRLNTVAPGVNKKTRDNHQNDGAAASPTSDMTVNSNDDKFRSNDTELPKYLPNFFGVVFSCISAFEYMKVHHLQVILCLSLAASVGLVFLLGIGIAKMALKLRNLRHPTEAARRRLTQSKNSVHGDRPPSPQITLLEDSQVEHNVGEVLATGSFTRFNHYVPAPSGSTNQEHHELNESNGHIAYSNNNSGIYGNYAAYGSYRPSLQRPDRTVHHYYS